MRKRRDITGRSTPTMFIQHSQSVRLIIPCYFPLMCDSIADGVQYKAPRDANGLFCCPVLNCGYTQSRSDTFYNHTGTHVKNLNPGSQLEFILPSVSSGPAPPSTPGLLPPSPCPVDLVPQSPPHPASPPAPSNSSPPSPIPIPVVTDDTADCPDNNAEILQGGLFWDIVCDEQTPDVAHDHQGTQLVQDPVLYPLGYFIHRSLHIVICHSCNVAIPQENVKKHSTLHGYTWKDGLDKLVDDAFTRHEIVRPAEFKRPANGGPPVEGLRVTKGYQCKICPYVCVGDSTKRSHYKSHTNVRHCDMFKPCSVQCFWEMRCHHHYISVADPIPSLQPLPGTLLSKLLAYNAERRARLPKCVPEPPSVRDVEIFVDEMRWLPQIGGCDVSKLVQYASLPKEEDRFYPIIKATRQYIDHFVTTELHEFKRLYCIQIASKDGSVLPP